MGHAGGEYPFGFDPCLGKALLYEVGRVRGEQDEAHALDPLQETAKGLEELPIMVNPAELSDVDRRELGPDANGPSRLRAHVRRVREAIQVDPTGNDADPRRRNTPCEESLRIGFGDRHDSRGGAPLEPFRRPEKQRLGPPWAPSPGLDGVLDVRLEGLDEIRGPRRGVDEQAQ